MPKTEEVRYHMEPHIISWDRTTEQYIAWDTQRQVPTAPEDIPGTLIFQLALLNELSALNENIRDLQKGMRGIIR